MSYIKADRVKESSTIVGTGTISLLGSNTGFRTFASQMSVGDTCSYVIANTTGSEWEVGIATYSSANTLTRTTVQSSTNANAVVNFSAGMKDVFISPTAQSVIDYNPITHQISNANSIVASPVASGVGNSLTITAGSGIGTGAGGSLILQAGLQASSGGDGKVIVKKVSGQTSNLQEWQNSDGTVVASIGNDGSIWTSGTNTVPLKPINYTYTGTLDAEPIIILSTPTPAQTGNTVGDYSGKWAYALSLLSCNQSLTSISFSDLQGAIQNMNFNGMNALTSISCPVLTTVGNNFSLSSLLALTSINFPALTYVGQGFSLQSLTVCTSASFPSLTTVISSFSIQGPGGLTSIDFPKLKTVTGTFQLTNYPITSMIFPSLTVCNSDFTPNTLSALTSMDFPVLTMVFGAFAPWGMNALTSMNFPALKTTRYEFNPRSMNIITSMSFPALNTIGNYFAISAMPSLTSFSMPSIVRIGINVTSGTTFSMTSGTAALTTFQLPSTLLQVGNGGGNVVITSAALNQTSVDSILVRLAALDGTNGTSLFSNRTVTITGTSSTPSATGLAAKATLVARGCTVTTN